MKTKLLVVFFIFILKSVFGQQELATNQAIPELNTKSLQSVIICSGSYSYAYHSFSNCPGLNNCRAQLYEVSEYDARYTYYRKPCCRCWTPKQYGCADDFSYNNSNASGGEAMGYLIIGAAIAATGVILVSNEFYLSPAIRFYKKIDYNTTYYSTERSFGKGWVFQFRKNFKHSGLEYGISLVRIEKTKEYDYYYNYNNYIYKETRQDLGIHLDYVHDIFYYKMPNKLNVFIGPSLNCEKNFHYGGVIGVSYQVFDRLKFDLRHKLTNQSKQIQLGLSFLYQKKYFWKKG